MAGTSRSQTYDSLPKQIFIKYAGIAFYKLSERKREEQMAMFQANPDVETAQESWGMTESAMVKATIKTLLPSVAEHHLIHVPKMDTRITLDNVDSLPSYDGNIFKGMTSENPQFQMLGENNYDKENSV